MVRVKAADMMDGWMDGIVRQGAFSLVGGLFMNFGICECQRLTLTMNIRRPAFGLRYLGDEGGLLDH